MPLRSSITLERHALWRQVAELLRERIRTGELTDPLPSEVTLASQLEVSRPVLRQALGELARQRLIVIANGKRTRLVRRRPLIDRSKRSRIFLISPLSSLHSRQPSGQIVNEIRQFFQSKGYFWNELNDPRIRFAGGTALLDESLQASPCDCLVLISSTESMQKWAARQTVPALVLGSAFVNVDLPSVDSDYQALGWHTAGRLAAQGHSRVAILLRNPVRQGDQATISGIQDYLNRHLKGGGELSTHFSRDREETCRQIDRLLRRSRRPTALVIFHPADAITALTYLLKAGLRIPQDMAILSRDSYPLMEASVPELTRYESNQRQLFRHAVHSIQSLCANQPLVRPVIRIIPRFVPGETL